MSREQILAGAGRAAVAIPEEFFPLEKFVGIHDCQQVRAVLFEREARIAIVSVEITSIMADAIEEMKDIVCERAGRWSGRISGSVRRTPLRRRTFWADRCWSALRRKKLSGERCIRRRCMKRCAGQPERRRKICVRQDSYSGAASVM